MKTPAVKESKTAAEFERRAARAELLCRESPASEEPLRFAMGLYRVQCRVAAELEAEHAGAPLSGHLGEDTDRLADRACDAVLRYAADHGPEALAEQARFRREDISSTAQTRLQVYWSGDRSSREDYLSRAILRPYVEVLRSVNVAPSRVHRRGGCPFCGGAPWVAVRREGSQSEGARRNLCCSLCGGEWLIGRILCPCCFEEDPRKLPIFQTERYPAARIETCETCRRYVKSIDLSLDARPIPEVDDLLSLSLDLWAADEGYTRIEPGMAGI